MTEPTRSHPVTDVRANSRPAAAPNFGVACLARPTFAVEYAEQIAGRALQAL